MAVIKKERDVGHYIVFLWWWLGGTYRDLANKQCCPTLRKRLETDVGQHVFIIGQTFHPRSYPLIEMNSSLATTGKTDAKLELIHFYERGSGQWPPAKHFLSSTSPISQFKWAITEREDICPFEWWNGICDDKKIRFAHDGHCTHTSIKLNTNERPLEKKKLC